MTEADILIKTKTITKLLYFPWRQKAALAYEHTAFLQSKTKTSTTFNVFLTSHVPLGLLFFLWGGYFLFTFQTLSTNPTQPPTPSHLPSLTFP